jgi:hypothetical protein
VSLCGAPLSVLQLVRVAQVGNWGPLDTIDNRGSEFGADFDFDGNDIEFTTAFIFRFRIAQPTKTMYIL